MRKYLIGAAITAAVFVGASFAWAPERAVAAKNAPLRLADLTLDRRVMIPFSLPGDGTPVSLPFPSYSGLVVERIEAPSGHIGLLNLVINGVDLGSWYVQNDGVHRPTTLFQHPIVVRPGDSVTVSYALNLSAPVPLMLSGWVVYPGEV